jgi:hypothetical protein
VPRARLAIATLVAATLLPVSAAEAGPYAQVLHAYQTTGTIPPCEFSSAQLATALKGVDTYGAQYFADFTNAIQGALTARASGACSHPAAASSPSAARPTSVPTGSPRVRSVTSPTAADLPAPMLLMAGLALAFALIGTVAAVGRARGWSPAWAPRWRHAWSEAGYRVGGTWAEFVDWLRSDR